jgi:hypothetical protein
MGTLTMGNVIEISDLRAPQLTDAQRAALAACEQVQVDFTEAGVLEAARARTGLADFGPDDFRLRLRLLLDEWGSDPDMLPAQRLVLFGYLVRYCSNRLLLQDFWKRNPQVPATRIERPLIVAGLPRSGTTHLVNLLAADRRRRSLPLWESYEPLPLPGERASGDTNDPRHGRCLQAWQGMQATLPLLAAMHPMNPDHIHEELELMGPDIASYNFEWLSPSPRWRDHYCATDQEPHYRYMRDVLATLQTLRAGAPRWVLKCPQHLEQLPLLRRIFPDATVVITHRDPVAVIQSTVTMLAYGARMRARRIDTAALLAYWSDRIERLLRACVRDRACWGEERSLDVPFHAFMADEQGTLARIHALTGDGIPDDVGAAFRDYIATHPRGAEGRVRYHLQRDFGCDPAALRERFAFYFDAFPAVRAESH